MWRILKVVGRVVLWLSAWLGLAYAPADIIGLPETYPLLRVAFEMERETLLIGFSGFLVAYLAYVEFRPIVRDWRLAHSWLPYPVAAQMIYEELKDTDMVSGLIRDSDHPRPVEDIMRHWIEDGLKRGIIKVRACREHSQEHEDIPPGFEIVDGVLFDRSGGGYYDEIAAKNPDTMECWRNLTVLASSVKAYLKDLEVDSANIKRRKALNKERRAELTPR